MRAYRVPAAVRDVIELLPLLAGVARSMRGISTTTSSNGIVGTMLPTGYVQYGGANLGLPFDVYGSPGQPVYGPLAPPPGVPVMPTRANDTVYGLQTPPQAPTFTYTPPAAPNYTPPAAPAYTPPANVPYNPGPGINPTVLTADYVPPAAETIGKEAGDTFSFTGADAQNLFSQAAQLAPWYVWAAAGAGGLLLFGAVIHHQTKRGNRRR